VGRGGKNKPDDVKFVQRALGLNEDGKCGPQTIGAIENFQKTLGQARLDGRIDAGGPTLGALLSRGKGTPAPSPSAGPDDEDSGLLGKLAKGARGLADDAKDLGGKILRGAEDLADDAKKLGGKVLEGAGKAANDPGRLRSSVSPDTGGGNSAQEIADRIIAKIKADADCGLIWP
jgi:peptidoglycan hydrolase-like protein with peptidoglycan-binding domain